MTKYINKAIEILKIIPDKQIIKIIDKENTSVVLHDGRTLLNISPTEIKIPGISFPQAFFGKPSPLNDTFVPKSQLEHFFDYLSSYNLFQRLNHLGFCYQVNSVTQERKRLIWEARKANWHLYEENSCDKSA